jgi:hypothetical protein
MTTTTHTVVQYLYVHDPEERFEYPTARARGGAAATAMRYLECALVQAGSLRLLGSDCGLVLVTNLPDPHNALAVSERGVRMIEAMEELGVEMVHAEYAHRNRIPVESYASSRYVLDALVAATAGEPEDSERCFWFTDVDCVWVNPDKVFAAAPPTGSIGCLYIPYPEDWDIQGTNPKRVGEFGQTLGDSEVPIKWVGGELLAGTRRDLLHLGAQCDALDDQIGDQGSEVPAEEHLLTLAGALGRVSYVDMRDVIWRLLTGPRHFAPRHEDPGSLGLWHLPSEKGLSFRRAANALLAHRPGRLRRDLEDPVRAMRRFNVAGTGFARRVRDDSWLAAQRLPRVLEPRT